MLDDGQVFGTLCVVDSEEVEVSEEQRAVLIALARLIARVHDDRAREHALRDALARRDELAAAVLERADSLLERGDLEDDLRGDIEQLREQAARAATVATGEATDR